MTSIGETLRRERLTRNLDLDQISRELKIPRRFLESIEAEHFDGLPAGVFTRSFVRQYANLLGLDGEALSAEVRRSIAPDPPAVLPSMSSHSEIHLPRVETWESVGGRRGIYSSLPALALVVVVMLVCSGVYAFWQRSHREGVPPNPEPPRAAAVRPPAAPPQTAPTTAPSPAAAAPAQTTPGPGAPDVSQTAIAAAQPAAVEPQQQAQQAPQANSADRPAPEGRAARTALPPPTAGSSDTAAAPAATGPMHVELRAQEPVWVLVRDNGKFIFSGTLSPNETRSFDATGPVTLRVGNAGGINVTSNGKALGSLGPKGQVRDVQLTSGGFHILAVPPKPAPGDGTPGPPAEPR